MNILYKCLKNSEFLIKVGDIGSITILDDYAAVSYVPYEYKNEPIDTETTEKGMVFLLGVLLLELLTNKEEIIYFHHSIFYKETKASYMSNIENTLLKYGIDQYKFPNGNSYQEMLLNMLNPDPRERLTLVKLIKYVN